MSLFGKLFNLKNDKTLINSGRGGFIYRKGGKEYFILSEWLTGNPDIVLYQEYISLKDSNDVLSIDDRKQIAYEVQKILELQGLSIEIHPI